MKQLKRIFPVTIILMLFLFAFGIAEETKKSEEITWYSLDKAIPMAKKQNKHIFIDFSTSWCVYCKKMDKEVFTQESVINLLSNDYIPVKIDGEGDTELDIDGYKITERELTKREFQVKGFPTFWFLKPDGNKLTNISGYKPADYMTAALTFIKDYEYDSTLSKNGTPINKTKSGN